MVNMIPSHFLAAADRVIVYRSRMEAEADEFWWGVYDKHPWVVLAIVGLLAAVLLWNLVRIFRK